jgi:hypothetical protein
METNRAKLFAQLRHFGEEMEEISHKEFVNTYKNNKSGDDIKVKFDTSNDFCCDYSSFSIDGWDYYSYSYSYKVGWEGDVDCDDFTCRIKRYTREEMEKIMSIISKF